MRKKTAVLSNDNAKSNTSTAYQRGNNKDGSPHYVFLYSDDDDDNDDGDDNNQIPLQLRINKSQKYNNPRKIEVITVTLKPEDTLQALSLRYGCTISELKRINNIHNDNEIFARRFVKVPVQPFSLLTEINENEDPQNKEEKPEKKLAHEANDLNNSIVGDGNKINNREQKKIIFPSTSSSSNNTNNEINNIIFNSLSIDPLKNNVPSDNTEINDSNESDELLLINEHERDSTPEARVIELFGCSGADWGLTWIHLLAALILFGFILPVIYIIFITENQREHFNSTNNT